MAAIFRPSANLAATLVFLGAAALLVGGVAWWWIWPRTDYMRHIRWPVHQPVPFSHEHHVAGLGTRLPVLPHLGGGVFDRRFATDLHLHDLPFSNLDQRQCSGAGAAKPGRQQADHLERDYQFAGLRLLQSQHSHRQGCWLFELSRGGRPHAA